jgi:hypothetical protein
VAKVVKAKRKCCKDDPRCKRCPVVLERLASEGLAKRKPGRRYRIDPKLKKKQLKAARARA